MRRGGHPLNNRKTNYATCNLHFLASHAKRDSERLWHVSQGGKWWERGVYVLLMWGGLLRQSTYAPAA